MTTSKKHEPDDFTILRGVFKQLGKSRICFEITSANHFAVRNSFSIY